MPAFRPKFITFDCYGTLTNFTMTQTATELFRDRIDPQLMSRFMDDYTGYRRDEVHGTWKAYAEVLHDALERTCAKHSIAFNESDATACYEAVPTWGPHADVPEGLARVAKEFPLVVLSNAADEQIMSNVELLGAPFHTVCTAEQANAYKPRFQAFEYMLDTLGCGPEDILHCSSSFRYDLMAAHDLGITHKVWVDRGHEPANPYYGYTKISSIAELPGVVGL